MKPRAFLASVILALVICTGVSVAPAVAAPDQTAPPATYTDVPATHPYFTAVEELTAAGVVRGYPVAEHREFAPDAYITRAQFTKMIVLAVGLKATEEDICPFADIPLSGPADLYPDNYIAAAVRSGIARGYDQGHYGGDKSITRAQVVAMAVRAATAVSAPLASPPPTFGTLGDFGATYSADVAKAEYALLLSGLVGFGPRWNPWQPASRGEAAEILWHLRAVLPAAAPRPVGDILQDLEDRKLDGAYRRAELQSFLDDPAACTKAGAHAVRLVRETLRDHPRIGRLLFDGDSLTAGSGTKTSYPLRLMATWPRRVPWKNIAVGGQRMEQLLKKAPQNVDPFYSEGTWRNVVVLWAGTNDIALSNHATALIYDELKQYARERRARGFTVVVLTLLPRTDKAVQLVPDFEVRRQALNRLIRSEWEDYADLLVDVGADARIGDAGDELDRTYYLDDKVHLNGNGQQLVADLVSAALHRLDDWAGILQ